ncbi:putative transcriptional regulator of fimbrial expression [Klebsiella pneumoniae]|uniref:Putative transcriptional regulator of fimbrial expression n=1 Tax=Klebsiella pneumoniae TaxID=573 RepID=A0A447RNV5_KLEPN|nr:putative transcriptional regulator of fimbrial expression [Klebsiella pneumoniae]
MILLIILFTPFLSSSNTWLQKQCIRKLHYDYYHFRQ